MVNIIHKPHDKLFRASMADIRMARDFFEEHLPEKILEKADLNTLALQNSAFIDEAYQASEADLVYAVKFDDTIAYFYLLCEHQSEIDQGMAFRLLIYIIRIMEMHRKQYPKDYLPIVYPLVVYSGDRKWDAPVDIFELFGEKGELAKELLLQPYQLIDIGRLDDSLLQKHLWSGLIEFALKYRHAKDLKAFFDSLFPWLKMVEMQQGEDFCRIVLNYVVDGLETNNGTLFIQKVAQHLSNSKLRGEAMTLAQKFREQGIEQGIEQGMELEKVHIAKKLLSEEVELAFIARITDLSLAKIQELQEEADKN